MKQDKVFAVVKKAGSSVEIRLIDKEPKTFSTVVEGKREIIPFPNLTGVCIVFDGAGQDAKKPNCFLSEYNDLLTGTVIVAGIDIENGFISLTELQAAYIEEYLKDNDAKGFSGDLAEKISTGYLPYTEENYVYGMLSEVKTKSKALKFKWMSRR